MSRSVHTCGWMVAALAILLLSPSCDRSDEGSGGGAGSGGTQTGSGSGENGGPVPDPDPGSDPDPGPDPEPVLPSSQLPADWFTDPGALEPLWNGQGATSDSQFTGEADPPVALPVMRFPLEEGPAFLNSQIFRKGGGGYSPTGHPIRPGGPPHGGAENAAENYDYPWYDNFCETRTRGNSSCASGKGHQGQDIRAATCEVAKHWAVAAERSKVRYVAPHHMIILYGLETGVSYVYLHLEGRTVTPADVNSIVERGQRLGLVSNQLGDRFADPVPPWCVAAGRCTTTHLHFETWSGATVDTSGAVKGVAAMSPYANLYESYLNHLDSQPDGEDWVNPVPQPSNPRDCKLP